MKIEEYNLKQLVAPLLEWYKGHARILPWREFPTPYRVWVSEIMLQQTRVEAVKPYFERFVEALPDIKSLAECPEEKLLKLWEGLGYYNRVRNMQTAAKQVMENYEGMLPEEYGELLKLKGIGHYTAGAVFSIAYGKQGGGVVYNFSVRYFRKVRAQRAVVKAVYFVGVYEAGAEVYFAVFAVVGKSAVNAAEFGLRYKVYRAGKVFKPVASPVGEGVQRRNENYGFGKGAEYLTEPVYGKAQRIRAVCYYNAFATGYVRLFYAIVQFFKVGGLNVFA